MDSIVLIGGGGHCQSVIDVIEQENKFKIAGIVDRSELLGTIVLGYEVIGNDGDLEDLAKKYKYACICAGQIKTSSLRERLFSLAKKAGFLLPSIISPRAYISKHSSIGEGSVIMHDALINADVTVGNNCIINTKSLVEHNSVVEDNCHISTGAIINGDVCVEKGTFFGSNAVSRQGVVISEGSFIEAGRCVSGLDGKPKVAFLTTVYPTNVEFIKDFFDSLACQTYKYFDLILLNDGLEDLSVFKREYPSLNIIELPSEHNIAKNRESLIKFSIYNDYNIAVFGDIDDYFSSNRVAHSVELLKKSDIVVNDLTSFCGKTNLNEKIYSNRIVNRAAVDLDFILDKNVFGLSNTAINLDKVNIDVVDFSFELISVDWFLFSKLLLSGLKATFTGDTLTYYRQHETNTIGIGSLSADKIQRILAVKLVHYRSLLSEKSEYKDLLQQTELLHTYSLRDLNKQQLIQANNLPNLLWWELVVPEDIIK